MSSPSRRRQRGGTSARRLPTLAAFTTAFAIGQTVGPWSAGILADHTSIAAAVAWTAILCTAAAAISATPPPRTGSPRAAGRPPHYGTVTGQTVHPLRDNTIRHSHPLPEGEQQ
ncbi:hypothetical protein OHB12_32595 [Nocardia sp. NBC_01730]|uniref:hypothetical protein n=1 Tax=Nocardia sp. NBC_01730 TaxID=2975998 RepID=UPI002E155B18|nr:hypothetical protein OHB12_32595 [Nocardia sp. NBC_01730]